MTIPPQLGRDVLDEWMLDPTITYLNHGTVGAPPKRVIAAQRALQDRIEQQPARFILRELADEKGEGRQLAMRQAMAVVAPHLGADAADTVFVDNITTGANAVFRSLPLAAGDEVVVTNLGYGGVTNAAVYAARVAGASVRTIALPGPGATADAYVDGIAAALTPRTRLVICDHITASTALVLPIRAIIDACHANGSAVFVDAAHAPGNIAVDIAAYGADWYCANLHKWLWTPRSSGVLWTAPAQQPHLHPAVISWGLDRGLAAAFDLPGTRDPSAHLTAPDALAMRAEWGEQRILDHQRSLALAAGEYLGRRFGTGFDTPPEMIGAMVTLRLPARFGSTADDAQRLRDTLLFDHRIEVPPAPAAPGVSDTLMIRVSCAPYTDMADIERLADTLDAI